MQAIETELGDGKNGDVDVDGGKETQSGNAAASTTKGKRKVKKGDAKAAEKAKSKAGASDDTAKPEPVAAVKAEASDDTAKPETKAAAPGETAKPETKAAAKAKGKVGSRKRQIETLLESAEEERHEDSGVAAGYAGEGLRI
jgi:hypothetical protein